MRTQRLKTLVLSFGVAAFLATLGLGSFAAFETSRRASESAWVAHTYSVLDELTRARLQLKDAGLGAAVFHLTADPAARDDVRRASETLRASAESLQNLTADNPPQAARAETLAAAAADLRASIEVRAGRGSPAEAAAASARAGETIQSMENEEHRLLRERTRRQSRSAALAISSLAVGALLAGIGGALALATILRGLDERERILDQLNAHEKSLEAANSELESFNYSVSHDLRAPLRAIDGFARILARDYAPRLDDEGRRLLDRVRANAEGMGRLIDSLLAFSRLGRKALQLSDVDMNFLARRAAAEAAAAEPGRVVTLTVGVLPPCRGDAEMLSLVWNNILSNAYKYTRNRPEAHVEVGGAETGEAAEYWVKDDGAGFDQRYAGKLFGVFSRLHSVAEFEGTGVGLALVRRVVERHGGGVSASGAVDKGADFRFTLPRGRTA